LHPVSDIHVVCFVVAYSLFRRSRVERVLSSLPRVLLVTRLGWKLLGLGPRSSRLDVLGGGVIDLVLFKGGGVGEASSGRVAVLVVVDHRIGKDAPSGIVRVVGRVHREPTLFGGVDREFHLLLRTDHAGEGSVQIIEVGLAAAAAASSLSSRIHFCLVVWSFFGSTVRLLRYILPESLLATVQLQVRYSYSY